MPSTRRRVAAPLRCQALRQQSPPKPTSPASAAGCAKRDPMQAHAPLRPHIWLPLATTIPKSWTNNAMDFRSPPHRAMARALQDRGHWRYPGFPVGLRKPFWLVSCCQFFGPICFGPTPADFFSVDHVQKSRPKILVAETRASHHESQHRKLAGKIGLQFSPIPEPPKSAVSPAHSPAGLARPVPACTPRAHPRARLPTRTTRTPAHRNFHAAVASTVSRNDNTHCFRRTLGF